MSLGGPQNANKSASIGGNNFANSLSPDKRGGMRMALNGRQNSIGQILLPNQS